MLEADTGPAVWESPSSVLQPTIPTPISLLILKTSYATCFSINDIEEELGNTVEKQIRFILWFCGLLLISKLVLVNNKKDKKNPIGIELKPKEIIKGSK